MRCRGLESSLCLVLAAVATAGCASLPPASSLMPGGAAKTNQTLESQLAMARLSERHGETRTAEQIYRGVLQQDPRNQLALHRLGVLAGQIGENEKAAEHLEAAAQVGPPSSELLNDIGFNLFVMKRLPEAEAAFRQAIAADPQNKAARNNLGLVLGETQRYEESLAEFRRGSSEAEAHANLAYAKTQAGDLPGAQSSYHQALTLDKELKPAAEALIQLAQQPARNADPHSAEPGRSGGAGTSDQRTRRPGASGEKTLAELVREGKTAEFLESVTERDRSTGCEQTFRPPAETAQTIVQAAYFAEDRPAGRDPRNRLAKTLTGGQQPSRRAEQRPSHFAASAAGSGGSFVLSRVFRFPKQTASEPASELSRQATRPREPAIINPRSNRLLSSFDPRANRQPPLSAPAAEAVPTARPNAMPEQQTPALNPSLLPAVQTASSNPWQAPTWTPDFTALQSAAMSSAATPPAAHPPTPPLANRQQ